MTDDARGRSEADRLEHLWAGSFGDQYSERNRDAGDGRGRYWTDLLARYEVRRILEVGSNVGANLRWIVDESRYVVGVDINQRALRQLAEAMPGVRAVVAAARSLPFAARSFDLVFTAGVLIHQPPAALPQVIHEIVRCSSRFVFCAEYYSEAPVEIPYREERAALFKRDFGGLFQRLYPQLALREHGQLTRSEGWDDVSFWLFERGDR